MNQSITVLYLVLETSSGKVFLLEKKTKNTSTLYYAFQFCKQDFPIQYLNEQSNTIKQLKNYNLFRQYQGIHLDDRQQLHIFDYYEDSQFLDKKILEYGKNKISFTYAEIKLYLKNLLIALYQLHQKKIPGRVFSIYNVLLVSNERLVLMDFGFGPDIKQDHLDILAPPEYIQQIIDNKENQIDFDFKFDVWLIGAILYNIIKFKSINQIQVQNTYERYKYDRIKDYNEYLKGIQFISCSTNRYNQNLFTFVEALLTCNREKRLSFYQIYQHKYIQELLNLENLNEYIDFYKKSESIKDPLFSFINTKNLPVVNSNLPNTSPKFKQVPENESQIINFQYPVTSPLQQTKKKIIIKSQHPIQDEDTRQGCPDYFHFIINTPQFSDSSFYTYWSQIQIDCLKCYILKKTSEKIITTLPKYQHPYEQILVYIIKKMHLIILREMDNYLKSNFFQNKPDQNWQRFLDQNQKFLPRSDQMNSYLKELTNDLIIIFQQYCQIHLQEDSQLTNILKKQLIDDNLQNHHIILNSQEYFFDGYNEELEILYQFINTLIVQNKQLEELNQLKQLIYFCLHICTFFQLDKFYEQFQDLGQQNQKVQPRDIINHLGIADQYI